jgi:hypothetical protein
VVDGRRVTPRRAPRHLEQIAESPPAGATGAVRW